MRRLSVLIAVILIFLGLSACGNSQETENLMNTESTAETESLPPAQHWQIDYFVDEFGDKTNEGFLIGEFNGTFSNTATNSSDLSVFVYVMPDSTGKNYMIAFRLAEYGNHIATYSSYDYINLAFKVNGEKYGVELMGFAPNGDAYLTSHYAYEDETLASYNKTDRSTAFYTLFNALKDNSGEVSCLITIGSMDNITSSVGGSTYRFKIDGYGFAEQLATLEDNP